MLHLKASAQKDFKGPWKNKLNLVKRARTLLSSPASSFSKSVLEMLPRSPGHLTMHFTVFLACTRTLRNIVPFTSRLFGRQGGKSSRSHWVRGQLWVRCCFSPHCCRPASCRLPAPVAIPSPQLHWCWSWSRLHGCSPGQNLAPYLQKYFKRPDVLATLANASHLSMCSAERLSCLWDMLPGQGTNVNRADS